MQVRKLLLSRPQRTHKHVRSKASFSDEVGILRYVTSVNPNHQNYKLVWLLRDAPSGTDWFTLFTLIIETLSIFCIRSGGVIPRVYVSRIMLYLYEE